MPDRAGLKAGGFIFLVVFSFFRPLGLQRGQNLHEGNLKKFPGGSLEFFGAPYPFLFGARGLPGIALVLPEGSRGGFGVFPRAPEEGLERF